MSDPAAAAAAATRGFDVALASMMEHRPPVSVHVIDECVKHALRANKYFKFIVRNMERFIGKIPPEYKLGALYVVDAVIRHSQAKFRNKDVYADRFAKNLEATFRHVMKHTTAGEHEKLKKILHLWAKKGVFALDLMQRLQREHFPHEPELVNSAFEADMEDPSSSGGGAAAGGSGGVAGGIGGGSGDGSGGDGANGGLAIELDDFDYGDDEDEGERIAEQRRRINDEEQTAALLQQQQQQYQQQQQQQQQQTVAPPPAAALNAFASLLGTPSFGTAAAAATTAAATTSATPQASAPQQTPTSPQGAVPLNTTQLGLLQHLLEQARQKNPIQHVAMATTAALPLASQQQQQQQQQSSLPQQQQQQQQHRPSTTDADGMPSEPTMTAYGHTLWAGNVPDHIGEEELRTAFGQFGRVENIDINRPKRCAFILMGDRPSAEHARRVMPRTEVNGLIFKINWSMSYGQRKCRDHYEWRSGNSYVPLSKVTPELISELKRGSTVDRDTLPPAMRAALFPEELTSEAPMSASGDGGAASPSHLPSSQPPASSHPSHPSHAPPPHAPPPHAPPPHAPPPHAPPPHAPPPHAPPPHAPPPHAPPSHAPPSHAPPSHAPPPHAPPSHAPPPSHPPSHALPLSHSSSSPSSFHPTSYFSTTSPPMSPSLPFPSLPFPSSPPKPASPPLPFPTAPPPHPPPSHHHHRPPPSDWDQHSQQPEPKRVKRSRWEE